jgi:hypothetical protein
MINLNEPTASNRRIPVYLYDSSGNAVTGVALSGAELVLSKNGAALANFGGSWTEIGGGLYVYEALASEVDTQGFLALIFTKTGIKTQCLIVVIGSMTFSSTLRLPFYLTDTSGNALTGLTFTASEIQITENGTAWEDFAGTMPEVGSGLYYYAPHATEFDDAGRGFVAVKVEKTGVKTTIMSEDLEEGSSSDPNPPVVSVVSPTPGVPAGSAGGFPRNLALAKETPIVLEIADLEADLQYVCVTARFSGSSAEEVVYRRDNFRGLYVEGSTKVEDGDDVTLTIRREGGWPTAGGRIQQIQFAVDAIDADGNLTTSGALMNIKLNGTLIASTDTINFEGLDVAEVDGVVTVTATIPEIAIFDGTIDGIVEADASPTGLKVLHDDGEFRAVAAASTSFAGARVYKSATQNLLNNTWTAVTWQSEAFDVGGYFDSAASATRFTVPVGKAGYYCIQGSIRYDGATGVRNMYMNIPGGSIIANPVYGDGAGGMCMLASGIAYLAEGAQVEMSTWQNSGGTRIIQSASYETWMSLHYLGA